MNMKKYLLLFLLTASAALFTYSQSLLLSDSAGSLPNDTTIYKYGLPSEGEIISYVFVTNATAKSISVKVEKVELGVLQRSENYFCWGACYPAEVFISAEPVVIDAGVTNTNDFSGHYIPDTLLVPGISTIRYVFFDENNPSDKVWVNINFDTYSQGVADLAKPTLSDAYPNPANNTVNFSFSVEQGSYAKLIIRNILGSLVKEIVINGESGKLTLNTSEFADGVYFYSFLANGNSQFTKKLVIRH
jgi:hypothetical protein